MSMKAKEIAQNLGMPIEIAQLAIDIFGSSAKVEEWFCTPINALNDLQPIQRLNTTDGKKEIFTILNKIACGEFT